MRIVHLASRSACPSWLYAAAAVRRGCGPTGAEVGVRFSARRGRRRAARVHRTDRTAKSPTWLVIAHTRCRRRETCGPSRSTSQHRGYSGCDWAESWTRRSESDFANVLATPLLAEVAGLLVLDLTPLWILGSHGVAALATPPRRPRARARARLRWVWSICRRSVVLSSVDRAHRACVAIRERRFRAVKWCR